MVGIITHSFYDCVSEELEKHKEDRNYIVNLETIAKNCGKTIDESSSILSSNLIVSEPLTIDDLTIKEKQLDSELQQAIGSDVDIKEIEEIRKKYREIGLDIEEETIKEYEWYKSWMHKDVAESSS